MGILHWSWFVFVLLLVFSISSLLPPILTTYASIPYGIPFTLMNCNALYRERVLVVMSPVGLTMLFTKKNNRAKLNLYDESFRHILNCTIKSQGAISFNAQMPYAEFAGRIKNAAF